MEDTRSKLWTSVVSLFRSQLEALELKEKISTVKIEELFENEMYITANSGVLSIWLDMASGEGSWNVITNRLDMAEPWFMSPDGKVELSGESMDIPAAVAKLIEKLSAK